MTAILTETLMNAAIMISTAGNAIERQLLRVSDEKMIETLELAIENIGYQMKDLNEVLTELKQKIHA